MIENILKIKNEIDKQIILLTQTKKNISLYEEFEDIKKSVALLTETYTTSYLKNLDEDRLLIIDNEAKAILKELSFLIFNMFSIIFK